ncbi:MAG: hypothetical protein AAGH19_11640 [Pseudomonadota bacterium]
MITLKSPMRLPTIAVLQGYLTRQPEQSNISVDGIFGSETGRAVRQFREENRMHPSNEVNYDVWRGTVGSQWQIIDSVDRTDPNIRDDRDLGPYQQTLLQQFGISFGTPLVIQDVCQSARNGQVVLLRFHGHGSPGVMNVASGTRADTGGSFASQYGQSFDRSLRQLRPIFAPFGSVELHGCRVGQGRAGRELLTRMAAALGVPVTGGVRRQMGGGTSNFRFEGPTTTVCPNGLSLVSWARRTCSASLPRPH